MGEITGHIALVVSIVALLQGYLSDRRTKELIDELSKSHERESRRVDEMMQYLMNRRGRP